MADPVLIKISELTALADAADDDTIIIYDESEPLEGLKVKNMKFSDLMQILRLEVCPDYFTGTFQNFRWFDSDDDETGPGYWAVDSIATPSGLTCGKRAGDAVPSALGDYVTINVALMAGTYTLVMCCSKGPTFGKFYLLADSVAGATQDFYAAAETGNNQMEFSFTLAENGVHELRFVNDGKNALSSDYAFLGSLFVIFKTG